VRLMYWMIASSISSPATRIDRDVTMPPSEMTATSVVPPDIDDHAARRLPYRQVRADRRRERLLDRIGFLRPGLTRSVLDRALLHRGDAGRYAYHHGRVARKQRALLLRLTNKIFNHRRRRIEIGDDAVLHRTHGPDVARRSPDHALRLFPDGFDRFRIGAQGDHGGFPDDDSFAFHVYKRVRCPEIDPEILRAETAEHVGNSLLLHPM